MKKLIILILLFAGNLSFAQTPQKINFQGVARDNAGNVLANQAISIQVSLHSTSTSGPIVYQETHGTQTSEYGMFSLEIGNGSVVSGTFSTITWGSDTYYIQLEIDPAGGSSYTDAGTTQLVSVPYALYAEKAAYVDSVPSNWTVDNNNIYNNNSGNVGIGTTSPISKLMIEDSVDSGDGRYLLRLNNPSTAGGSLSGIILDAGSLSDNDGNLFLEMLSETYQSVAGYEDYGQIRASGGGLVLRASDDVSSGNTPDIRFQTKTVPPANGAYDRMIITHDGNVGIGTTAPLSKLFIEHSASSGDGRYILNINNPSTGSGSLAGIKLDAGSSSDNDGNLYLEMLSETFQSVAGYEDYGQIRASGGGLVLRASDALSSGNTPDIRFQTQTIAPANGAYDRMIITHEGNVGIGTTTPTTKLQLTDGDFYLDNSANGVIIKSPNGSCWKITVDDTGALTTVSVTCP